MATKNNHRYRHKQFVEKHSTDLSRAFAVDLIASDTAELFGLPLRPVNTNCFKTRRHRGFDK